MRHRTVALALLSCVVLPGGAAGQTPPSGRASGPRLFILDLAGTPVGDVPASIEVRKGLLEVVQRDGVPMLKASAASEFVIQLSQVLPRDFTLEFDLVPKLGSNPQDLSFEGTPTINQGDGSAHVLWHATGYFSVIGGGGDTYEAPMPEELRATLPGVLTHVVVEVQGDHIKLYTNGRQLFSLQKQFARGRVLRVFLGGQNGGTEAVYLAGLRAFEGTGFAVAVAPGGDRGSQSGAGGAPGGSEAGQQPKHEQTDKKFGPSDGTSAAVISGLTIKPAPDWGVILEWNAGPGVAGFNLEFSDAGGPFTLYGTGTSGNSRDPAQPGLTSGGMRQLLPGHQYQFRITGTASDGSSMGSDVRTFTMPPQWPQVTNLATTVGSLEQLTVPPDNQTLKPARQVTWTYDPMSSGLWSYATLDRISADPVTQQSKTVRAPANPMRFASGSSTAVEAGTRLHLCVAHITSPWIPSELIGESCQDVDIPPAASAISPTPATLIPATTPPANGGTITPAPAPPPPAGSTSGTPLSRQPSPAMQQSSLTPSNCGLLSNLSASATSSTSAFITWGGISPACQSFAKLHGERLETWGLVRWFTADGNVCPSTYDEYAKTQVWGPNGSYTSTLAPRCLEFFYDLWWGAKDITDFGLTAGGTYSYRIFPGLRSDCPIGPSCVWGFELHSYPPGDVTITLPNPLTPGKRPQASLIPPKLFLQATIQPGIHSGGWYDNEIWRNVLYAWAPTASAVSYVLSFDELEYEAWGSQWYEVKTTTVQASPNPTYTVLLPGARTVRACIAIVADAAALPDPRQGECIQTDVP